MRLDVLVLSGPRVRWGLCESNVTEEGSYYDAARVRAPLVRFARVRKRCIDKGSDVCNNDLSRLP